MWPIFGMILAVAVLAGSCDTSTNGPNGEETVTDHVETDHYELDLTAPPSRAAVGLWEGSVGKSVYFSDEPQRTFEAEIALPEGVDLNLQPRLIAIDATVDVDRPRDMTPETAPPGHVGAQFRFDDTDGLRAFLTDLAAQLGERSGGLTAEYIDDAVERADESSGQPRIATTQVGYLELSVQPRSVREGALTPHLLLDLRWSAMPDDGVSGANVTITGLER